MAGFEVGSEGTCLQCMLLRVCVTVCVAVYVQTGRTCSCTVAALAHRWSCLNSGQYKSVLRWPVANVQRGAVLARWHVFC